MYIKRFLLFLVVCYSNITFADVIIFNKSSRYDMDVTYNFCTADSDFNYTCSPTELIKVKHVGNNESGYASISAPPATTEHQAVIIRSAIQKDETGKVIAQATYSSDENDGSCGTNTIYMGFAISEAVILEDYPQLPIITCRTALYNKEKIN